MSCYSKALDFDFKWDQRELLALNLLINFLKICMLIVNQIIH